MDKSIKTPWQAFKKGLTRGNPRPSGKGRRLIVCHLGSEDGFLEGADMLWVSGTKNPVTDYHSDMDAKTFEFWLEKIVIPKLPPNSVLGTYFVMRKKSDYEFEWH